MAHYQYEGLHYELPDGLSNDAAIGKIKAHLESTNTKTPAPQTEDQKDAAIQELENDSAKKGQVYVKPFGSWNEEVTDPVTGEKRNKQHSLLSSHTTANLYSWAERASASVTGLAQMLGIGDDKEQAPTQGTGEKPKVIKGEVSKLVQKRQALENNPNYSTGAKVSGVVGMITDPVAYAVPLAKAKTLGQFVIQSAYMGGALGAVGAKTDEESRVTNAAAGAVGGAVGGAILGSVIRAGGKLYGKDWLPWKATTEEKKEVLNELYKHQVRDATETQLNPYKVFLDAPEDAHINAKLKAEKLIKEGAPTGKVKSIVEKNPLVGHYLDSYREMHSMLEARFTAGKDTPRTSIDEAARVKEDADFAASQREAELSKRVGPIRAAEANAPDLEAINKESALAANNEAARLAAESRIGKPTETNAAELEAAKEQVKSYTRLASKEQGSINPQLATQLSSTMSGVVFGATMNPEDPWSGALIGGMVGAAGGKAIGNLIAKRGAEALESVADKGSVKADFFRTLSSASDESGVTKALHWMSNRLENESPELAKMSSDFELKLKKDTFDIISSSDSAFVYFKQKAKTDSKYDIDNLAFEGRASIKEAVKDAPKEVQDSVAKMFKDIDITGKELLKRDLVNGLIEGHLPRMVKDVEGLKNHLGIKQRTMLEQLLRKEAVKQGLKPEQLDDYTVSQVCNKYLRTGVPAGTGKPGFTKARQLDYVEPELRKYYHGFVETYHSYMARATSEIKTADFYGRSMIKNGVAIDIEGSIGNKLNVLRAEGKIKPEQEDKIKDILETRFKYGNRIANNKVQLYKNTSTALMLADVSSAAQSSLDVVLSMGINDIKPTLAAVVQQLTGKRKVTMEDFGSVNHISEEFVSSGRSKVYLDRAMKLSLWGHFDPFGKEILSNASIIQAQTRSKSYKGLAQLEREYGPAFGKDFPQLVKDLQSGETTELVQTMAFYKLGQSHPMTKMQRSELQSRYPNAAGVIYMWKSFMMGQANLVKTRAYDQIKKGNVKDGLKNLAALGVAFAASGAANTSIQNFLRNKDEDPFGTNLVWGAFRQVGISKYAVDKIASEDKQGNLQFHGMKGVGEATINLAAPPTSLVNGWLEKDALGNTQVDQFGVASKLPIVGKEVAGHFFKKSADEVAYEKKIKAEYGRIYNSKLDQQAKAVRIKALREKLELAQRERSFKQKGAY